MSRTRPIGKGAKAMDSITIDGMGEILSRLDRLPDEAQREFEVAAKRVAAINAVKIRIGAVLAGRQAALAGQSVHASGTAIVGGGPFFMGSVFGGQGRPTTQQFKPYRASSFWFFATLRSEMAGTMDEFMKVLVGVEQKWAD